MILSLTPITGPAKQALAPGLKVRKFILIAWPAGVPEIPFLGDQNVSAANNVGLPLFSNAATTIKAKLKFCGSQVYVDGPAGATVTGVLVI